MAVFEATVARAVLLAFPNIFEFWFIAVTALRHQRPGRRWSRPEALTALLALTALKEFQEYALHAGRWLDGFTIVQALQALWRWLTPW